MITRIMKEGFSFENVLSGSMSLYRFKINIRSMQSQNNKTIFAV